MTNYAIIEVAYQAIWVFITAITTVSTALIQIVAAMTAGAVSRRVTNMAVIDKTAALSAVTQIIVVGWWDATITGLWVIEAARACA